MAKKNLKEEIVNTARRLFNQRGMAAVSMRDIAETLGISVGNLTYHFPRKEELADAVAQDLHQYYRPPAVPNTLQKLNALLPRMQNDIQQNAFYFWHCDEHTDISPAVCQMQTEILKDQTQALHHAFLFFAQEGLFQKELYDGHFAYLAQAVLMLCIYWTPQCKLEEDTQAPRDFLDCVWSVLFPCLTEQGRLVYQEKIQKVRVDFDAQ